MNESSKTYVYHQVLAPKGRIVTSEEAVALYKAGWVDTPKKFGKGLRGKWYSLRNGAASTGDAAKQFYKNEWKWLIPVAISVVGLYIAYIRP